MKYLFIFLALTVAANAALPSTAVINVRSTATAGNLNGGGFNSARGGTDYSLQDTAQINGLTDGTSNVSTTFTSATGSFTAAMVGNYLHLTAGTNSTPGWYEIVTYNSATSVVLDRACSTGAMTNGTFYVGGAMSMASTLDDDIFEACVPGNTVTVKSGTYTLGETVTIAIDGSTTVPIKVIGYTTTPGDTCTGTNRPLFDCGANGFGTGDNWHWINMRYTGTASAVLNLGLPQTVVNCKSTNTSTTASRTAIQCSGIGMLLQTEAVSYRGPAVTMGTSNAVISGCWFHDSTVGITLSATTATVAIVDNIIESNTTAAIQSTAATTANLLIQNNTLFGSTNTTGTGIILPTGATQTRVLNNIITGFATGISHADTQSSGYDNFNIYHNNDADVSAAGQWQKGANSSTIAPSFSNVSQVVNTGTVTAGASDNILTDTGANFTASGVVAGRDYVYLVSGTNCTAGVYGITSVGTTTLTLDLDPTSASTGSSIVYQITTGRNFAVGTALKALAFPGTMAGGYSTGYKDPGALQRQETTGSGTASSATFAQ